MKSATCQFFGLLMTVLLAGCAAAAPAPAPAPRPEPAPEIVAAPEHTINYECDNGLAAAVTLRGAERAVLKIAGAATELTATRTASGVKFAAPDNSITFWSVGNEAQIVTRQPDRETRLSCRIAP